MRWVLVLSRQDFKLLEADVKRGESIFAWLKPRAMVWILEDRGDSHSYLPLERFQGFDRRRRALVFGRHVRFFTNVNHAVAICFIPGKKRRTLVTVRLDSVKKWEIRKRSGKFVPLAVGFGADSSLCFAVRDPNRPAEQ